MLCFKFDSKLYYTVTNTSLFPITVFTECNFSDLTKKIFVGVNKLNPVILVST